MPGPNSADTERDPGAGRGRPEGAGEAGGSGEFAAIVRLAARLARSVPGPPPGEVWIGDDAAVLAPPRGRLLLTTDVSVAGVHADLAVVSVADLGWRALVASISDVAAMGGVPRHAVVAVAGPPDADLDGLYEGIAAAAAAFSCPVVGGDLSGADRLTVAVAVTGEVPDPPGAVCRSGARPGERILLTGPLGASAAGLRSLRAAAGGGAPGPASLAEAHRRPRPRPEAGGVARHAGVSAMVDVSDGLLADLGHLADASGVGFRIDDVPVAPGATEQEALAGGEDYELVMVTADEGALAAAFARHGLRPPIPVGWCVDGPDVRTVQGAPAPPAGWEHSFGAPLPHGTA